MEVYTLTPQEGVTETGRSPKRNFRIRGSAPATRRATSTSPTRGTIAFARWGLAWLAVSFSRRVPFKSKDQSSKCGG